MACSMSESPMSATSAETSETMKPAGSVAPIIASAAAEGRLTVAHVGEIARTEGARIAAVDRAVLVLIPDPPGCAHHIAPIHPGRNPGSPVEFEGGEHTYI